MFSSLMQTLWGKFESRDEQLKFLRLSAILAFTIGVYSLLYSTKDAIFITIIGVNKLPYAKWFSTCMTVFFVIGYSALLDRYRRHNIFYVLCGIYSFLMVCAAIVVSLFMYSDIVAQQSVVFWVFGWLWYAIVESFASLMVALFWSFASDISTPDQGKRGYSILALGAQFGGVFAPLIVHQFFSCAQPNIIIIICAFFTMCIAGLVAYFIRVTPAEQLSGYHTYDIMKINIKKQDDTNQGPDFFEGLKLIFAHTYLLGIFSLIAFYDIISTILEYHMKFFVAQHFTTMHDMTAFFLKYSFYTNSIAFLSLLFGIGAIGRSIGVRITLVLFPIIVGIFVCSLAVFQSFNSALIAFMMIKVFNYSLNQPNKEQLYIPTSFDSRYKSKAWIDVFGSRFFKSTGAGVHTLRSFLGMYFLMFSLILSFGFIMLWIFVAWRLGSEHARAIREDKIIC